MKINVLQENEPLEVIEVTNHVSFNPFPNPNTGELDKNIKVVAENKQIQMKIFTDGEIEKESEDTIEKINQYYIEKNKYPYQVDTLKTKKIYFKNHSYVITFLLANEYMTVGNITGWFNVIKNISIYLQNPKDKVALKRAKQIIREIEKHNNSIDYFSIFGMLLSGKNKIEKIKPEQISKNVYSLKKKK